MGLIWVLLAGAFIGWIASKIMGTDEQMGALANIIVGLVGAMIGRGISALLLHEKFGTDFSIPGLLFGVLGACVLIWLVGMISGRGRRTVV